MTPEEFKRYQDGKQENTKAKADTVKKDKKGEEKGDKK